MHMPAAWSLLRRVSASATPGAAGRFASGAPASGEVACDDVAVLILAELPPASWTWGWSRVALGGWPLRRVPGLRFAKALGSGFHGGFGLRPSASRQGLFAVFGSEAEAEAFLQGSATVADYRARAKELCIAVLRATSSRGEWRGERIGVSAETMLNARVAALTRASIRPHKALRFWRRSPPAEEALHRAEGCLLAVGLGEAPLVRQATFSVWESQAAMDAYARSGAHLDAIRAAARDDYFSESMFVRFVPLRLVGTWHGRQHG